jgi:hypothetical protein
MWKTHQVLLFVATIVLAGTLPTEATTDDRLAKSKKHVHAACANKCQEILDTKLPNCRASNAGYDDAEAADCEVGAVLAYDACLTRCPADPEAPRQ